MKKNSIAHIALVIVFVVSIMGGLLLPIFAPHVSTELFWWVAIVTGLYLY